MEQESLTETDRDYLIEIDQEVLPWLLKMMNLHLPILSLALRKFAKSKIRPYYCCAQVVIIVLICNTCPNL